MAPSLAQQLRLHAVGISGEFVGTFFFLLMALSAAQVANSDTSHADDDVHPGGINLTQLLYIALAFGFSLAVNVSIFANVSGGLFNPAVGSQFSFLPSHPHSKDAAGAFYLARTAYTQSTVERPC